MIWQKNLTNSERAVLEMSLKNRDEHNRWRNKTVAFRVSPEEDKQIEHYVQLSGLTKQDYITRRLTHKDVVVQGNPRVFKALRNQLADVLSELQRIETGGEVNDELLDLIEMIADILGGLKEESE
jgi:hypothetical protein